MTNSVTTKRRCWTGVRCSPADSTCKALVLIGGFGDADEFAVLDLLDALLRKSLLVAHPVGWGGPGSRCWKQSGNSPRNNSSRVVKRPRLRWRTPSTSPNVRPTSSDPLGQPRGSARPTNGSPRSWRTCVSLFGSPPTTATSTLRPPSPTLRGALWSTCSRTMSRLPGPKSSSISLGLLTEPRLARLFTLWRRCAGRRDESTRRSNTSLGARAKTKFKHRNEPVFGLDGLLWWCVCVERCQHEECFEWYQAYRPTSRDNRTLARSCLASCL